METVPRCAFESLRVTAAGFAVLTILAALYDLLTLRHTGICENIPLWATIYGSVGLWVGFAARARWKLPQDFDTRAAVPPTVVMVSKTGRVYKLLTAQQQEVLRHMAEGLSNREIADRLSLSPETVRGHKKGIYRHLAVHNQAGAVQWAREHGYIE